MKLTVDMKAPAFEAGDIFGNLRSLEGYAGKTLLLSFFRNGACAMCNLQVHKLIERYPEYHRQGLEILAVFESPRESVLTHVSKQSAPFPIIADPKAALYELYGLETSKEKVMAPVDEAWRKDMIREAEAIGYSLTLEDGSNFFRLPADFLIGPDGHIQAAFYSEVVGEHITWEQIEDALRQVA
jgi:thioredoxin-dependent peroxiredoxin